jgi:deoxyribodipyrimidine photo-lyase
VSIRGLVASALSLNETFLKELVWRELFMQLLWHQPRLEKEACKTEYDQIEWRNNEAEFSRWCEGKTGYPIVDAGMRQLNATSFMHNRVRMVAASFLVKHLLIDWRWGEAYFARKLLDFDLAANNGNWQWVAGCGCDAAPYFRIFNPTAQAERFDNAALYIKQWVPEWGTEEYPEPMVDHKMATARCLATYKKALGQKQPELLE